MAGISVRNDIANVSSEYIERLPKVELHAHISGSLSDEAISYLIETAKDENPALDSDTLDKWNSLIHSGNKRSIKEVFQVFKIIQSLSRTPKDIQKITELVIKDFHKENVKYLELRSTPRSAKDCMTKSQYIRAVLQGIKNCRNMDIIVKFLVSLDRGRGIEDAENSFAVLCEMLDKDREARDTIVGIDLSENDARDFIPLLRKAKERGLQIAIHLAEIKEKVEEVQDILGMGIDRIGHGTYLHPDVGGKDKYVNFIKKNRIPLEICLTSNFLTNTVKSLEDHHFSYWNDIKHPIIICTDDKGVFRTSLSKEIEIAQKIFNLSKENIWKTFFYGIESAFCSEKIREELIEKFKAAKLAMI